jgi:hypothetical protein
MAAKSHSVITTLLQCISLGDVELYSFAPGQVPSLVPNETQIQVCKSELSPCGKLTMQGAAAGAMTLPRTLKRAHPNLAFCSANFSGFSASSEMSPHGCFLGTRWSKLQPLVQLDPRFPFGKTAGVDDVALPHRAQTRWDEQGCVHDGRCDPCVSRRRIRSQLQSCFWSGLISLHPLCLLRF